ncbi:MAG TPA: LLM class flavin-dependent oxidoreductase [Microbacterium sp.]|uniref:LLM class flavin-dependent oxidoreductase n=1 Tax=Microbacterium sp. TaxID=51671 RepID=UPI002C41FA78|nr:LLM class flavin-dependent oxidoreductase [Microbacterium sp.]HWI30301.1 LLM class flavin-dependent oxidoreductase [Microbacterium sp.]
MSDATHENARVGVVSVGVAGVLGPDAIARIAAATERAGFHALWVNDTPGGDSIAGLRAAAEVTETLRLATGVIPLDRRPAREVGEALRVAALPGDRLVLGIGSGSVSRGALALVRESITLLRDATPGALLVGALGPKMRELGSREADGVLLNWVTPRVGADQAAEQRELVAPRPTRVVAYARTIVDAAARERLEREVSRYATAPKYAANFVRLGIDPFATVLPQPGDDDIRPGVAAFAAAVDEVVLRAIVPDDDVTSYLDFLEQAAQALEVRGRP